jgi:hypothetical protein
MGRPKKIVEKIEKKKRSPRKPPALRIVEPEIIKAEPFLFRVQLSDPKEVPIGPTGNQLRVTLTWRFEHPTLGEFAESMEGCLLSRNPDGRLVFAPPLTIFRSKMGFNVKKHTILVSRAWHDYIVRAVEASSWARRIGNTMPAFLLKSKATPLSDIDPSFPTEVERELGENDDESRNKGISNIE